MAETMYTAAKIAARCKRLGWQVESGGSRVWLHRITCPDGYRVQLHQSPSDHRWETVIWRQLNDHGFQEAEAAYMAAREEKAMAAIARDRQANEAKTRKLAAQSAAIAKAAGPFGPPPPVDINWLMTPSDHPETRTVLMTPEAAERLIDPVGGINTHNRPMSFARVSFFEDLIDNNEFGCTHQGGAVDSKGVLQDGQSRCRAIANKGVSVPMQWSVGMPPENFTRVDTGTLRSARDTAYIMGETDPASISTTSKMLVILGRYGSEAHIKYRSVRVSNDAVEDAIQQHGDLLRQCVADAKAIKRDLQKINKSSLSAAMYLIRSRAASDDPRVDQFFSDLRDGPAKPDRKDSVWLLRRLLSNADNTHRRGHNAWEQLAYLIKAWNIRATGRRVENLVWRKNEGFPFDVLLPPPLADDDGDEQTPTPPPPRQSRGKSRKPVSV